jgi:hypothetical protein
MYIMTSKSLLSINLLNPVLFYQNPENINQLYNDKSDIDTSNCRMNQCRSCNKNLTSNDPASQYQKQKIIQNTVRVPSSLYTMNLAGLAGYQKPLNNHQLVEQNGSTYIAPAKVYWNQMSDRPKPANQVTKVASGTTYHTSSTRHTITRDRPGAMSPGGVGVDIKHNSYVRYLNKLKGKSTLRRGIIPPTYGSPIPFNRAHPVYGGKVVKTSIINGCDCPDIENNTQDKLIYDSSLNAIYDKILSVKYTFKVGDYVWAKKYKTDTIFSKGQIIKIENEIYTVQFDDITVNLSYCELSIYFNCDDCTNHSTLLSLKEQLMQDLQNISEEEVIRSYSSLLCTILDIL